jgi:hypothetical protein
LLVKSVTDLEIDEVIRDAWRIVQGGSASASPLARQLAAVLLAMTAGTQAHPHESNRNRGRACPPTMFRLHPSLPQPEQPPTVSVALVTHLIAFVEIAFISILLRLLLEGALEPFDMGSI